jgi:hypothetical protein
MSELFQDKFTVKIDTSACKSIIAGHDIKLNDTWYYSSQSLENGKIYGIVSEYGQGCQYLSYLLGGRIRFESVRVLCNDTPITQNDLYNVAWNLEPLSDNYGKKIVRKSIEKALISSASKENFQNISDRFLLTPERYDRKFIHLSGERWKASAALGYASGKKIFFAPYKTSEFYCQMCQSGLLKVLDELKKYSALIVLPAGSDKFMKHIADEIIYIDPDYDIKGL